MSNFTKLTLWEEFHSYDDDKRPNYVTRVPIFWEMGVEGSGLFVTVPTGFVFNVSIPRGLFWLLSPADFRFRKAACLHDYLISKGWDRVSSASAFSSALKATGVGTMTRLAMVLSVIIWDWS